MIRQKLAKLYTLQEIGRISALRMKSRRGLTGGEPNIAKLMMSDLLRLQREVGNEIIGPFGMVMGADTPGRAASVQEMTLFSPGPSIYGGTDQVQRNIIGERVLGLPEGARAGARTRRSASCSSTSSRCELWRMQ